MYFFPAPFRSLNRVALLPTAKKTFPNVAKSVTFVFPIECFCTLGNLSQRQGFIDVSVRKPQNQIQFLNRISLVCW